MLFIEKDIKINEKIREREIRLVGQGESSIMSTKEALEIARNSDLDLVMFLLMQTTSLQNNGL